MAKNFLKSVMTVTEDEHKLKEAEKIIEKIETGYLKNRGTKFRKKKSFSPSTLVYGNGRCPRYWQYAFTGAEFSDDADAYAVANMTNGTMSHERIQKAMKDSGFLVEDEVKLSYDDPPIFGFCDGIAEWDGEQVPIEIKTMRDESFEYRRQANKAPSYHIEQLLYYMKILKKSNGLLIYESKNSHKLHVIFIEITDEYRMWMDDSFQWMKDVHQAWKDGEQIARPYRSNSKVCKGCPVKEQCFADDKDGKKMKPLGSIDG